MDTSEKDVMMTGNKVIVRRYFEGFLNKGDPTVADNILALNVVLHGLQTIQGLPHVKQYTAMLRNAFPDLRLTVDDEIDEGEKVVTRFTTRGTHAGAFLTFPPTGRSVMVRGVEIFRIAEGKIEEIWAFIDVIGLMQQLGILRR
ncbi:MAG: ester cyclase, partial [Candidatus Bathyarchaeia archaeon]